MAYEPEVYIIPANVSHAGKILGGMIEIRNMVEAIIIAGVLGIMWWILTSPFGLIPKTITFCFFVAAPAGIALIGIRGESVLQFGIQFLTFRKKKRKMMYKIPRKEEKKKKRSL